ncbi:hypothetical protein JCM8547_002816 [Rhodosporidiobolus lusitaniae]
MLKSTKQRRPSLMSRLSSRRSTPIPLPPDEDLRLPLELILRIFDLSSSSCPTPAARETLHRSLRSVNRFLAARYSRKHLHIFRLNGGEDLPDLVKRLKKHPKIAEELEGIELRNMIPHESREGLEKNWDKLVKLCKALTCVKLGDESVRVKLSAGIPAYQLGAMQGVTVLRLENVELNNFSPSVSFFRRSGFPPSQLPTTLRHLSLSSVMLNGATSMPATSLPSLLSSRSLTSLFLADLQLSRLEAFLHLSCTSLIADLLRGCAPSLKALHYSRRLSAHGGLAAPEPSVLDGLSFPHLRILSLSLPHFTPSLFSSAPRVTHVYLTMCDLIGGGGAEGSRSGRGHSPDPDHEEGEEHPPAPPVWPALETLVLPARRRVGFLEQETSSYQRAEERRKTMLELASARGVEASTVYFEDLEGEDSVDHRFRRAVREVLGEKV